MAMFIVRFERARELEVKKMYELPSLPLLNTTWGLWDRLSTSLLDDYGAPVNCTSANITQCELQSVYQGINIGIAWYFHTRNSQVEVDTMHDDVHLPPSPTKFYGLIGALLCLVTTVLFAKPKVDFVLSLYAFGC